MIKQLTIRDKKKAKSAQALEASRRRELLPEVKELVSQFPETHPGEKKDVRKPRSRKPRAMTPAYIKETLGPYIQGELAKLSGEQFSPEMRGALIEFTLAKVAAGKTIAEVCSEEGRCFPEKEVLYNWIMRNEETAQDYKLAAEMSVESKVDSTGYDVEFGADLDRVKLKVKFLQWYASKKMPKQYGESKHLVIDQTSNVLVEQISADMSPAEASKVYMDSFLDAEDEE